MTDKAKLTQPRPTARRPKKYPVVREQTTGKVYDLNLEDFEWLRGYTNDPYTLQFILRGLSCD